MEVPRYWRLQKARYSLQGEVCPVCQTKNFPAKPVCPTCQGTGRTILALDQKEELMVFSALQEAPAGYSAD